MPQQLFWVREKESGQAFQMHSVDAAEGLALGDFEIIAEPQKDLNPEERAAATLSLRATGGAIHPELQTPEQRAETRRKANELAAMTAEVPPGAQVVVMAPQAAASGRSTSASSAASTSSSAAPTSSSAAPTASSAAPTASRAAPAATSPPPQERPARREG